MQFVPVQGSLNQFLRFAMGVANLLLLDLAEMVQMAGHLLISPIHHHLNRLL